jgi:hypothetical protein
MDATKPFDGRLWPLAPLAIDYIADRLGVPNFGHALARLEMFKPVRRKMLRRTLEDRRARAGAALKEALAQGDVRAQGPINRGPVAAVEREFWRFAVIRDDGFAVDLKSQGKLDWFEVNADDVLRLWPQVLTQETVATTEQKHPGGRPAGYDWEGIEQRLERECVLLEGGPHRNHPDPEWRTQNDAYRFILDEFTWEGDPPSDSTLKRHVPPMLRRIAAKQAKGQN